MTLRSSLAWLSLALWGCGEPPSSVTLSATGRLGQAISSGRPSSPGAFPGVAFLDVGCTAVLLSEDILVYAAHCGLPARAWFGDRVGARLEGRQLFVDHSAQGVDVGVCEAFPNARIGTSSDVAFCRLVEPAPVPREDLALPLSACERARLEVGSAVTLVGFGLDETGSGLGVKRQVEGQLQWDLTALSAGDQDAGTCFGDSGGPMFKDLAEGAESSDWRVLGLLSAGRAAEACGAGRYVDLVSVLPWLELRSGRDLSPCSDEFQRWRPGSRCRAASLDADGVGQESSETPYLASCGDAFDERAEDRSPPIIETLDRSLIEGEDAARWDVSVRVRDVGFGIERVRVALLDRDDEALAERTRDVPPFRFELEDASERAVRVQVVAFDHGGLSSSVVRDLYARPGCSVTGGTAASSGWFLLWALFCWARRRRGE